MKKWLFLGFLTLFASLCFILFTPGPVQAMEIPTQPEMYADVAPIITPSPRYEVMPGQDIEYFLGASNSGPNAAANMVLTVAIPDGTIFKSIRVNTPGCTVLSPAIGATSGYVQITLPDMETSVTLESFMVVTPFGPSRTIAITGTVSTDTIDPNQNNNSMTETVEYHGAVFSVSFDSAGGTPAPSSQSLEDGSKIVEPAAMTRTGYAFTGWFTAAAPTTPWNFNTQTISGATNLLAGWQKNQYPITYVLDGGANVAGNPNYFSIDGEAIALQAPTREGYHFDGWFDAAIGGNQVSSLPTQNLTPVTVYARWTALPEPIPVTGENDAGASVLLGAALLMAAAVLLAVRRWLLKSVPGTKTGN